MNTRTFSNPRSSLPSARREQAAFTMVEIALCIAIIGFALVAIIGMLPTGLNVQRDNREETIIRQDATYLMDAIRSGSRGMYDLTNYFEKVSISNNLAGATKSYLPNPHFQKLLPTTNSIIGFLTTPKFFPGLNVTNLVTAQVQAISGSAVEKPPSTSRDVAFKYLLTSEIIPILSINTSLYDYSAKSLTEDERNVRSNLLAQARTQIDSLYEIRLTFRWPLLPNGKPGGNKQVFRSTVGGVLTSNLPPESLPVMYYFQPRLYSKVP